jgi:nucleotide-binding universal stress UspA family protein
MKTILLATDGSPSAARATDVAIEIALAANAPLHAVAAWSIPISAFGYAPMMIVPEVSAAEREKAGDAVAQAVGQAEAAGVSVSSEVREGPAVEEICAAAGEIHASLVVVGAHGWGALKRLVFGSVSTGVLHHAPCPVLVVRGDPAAEPVDTQVAETATA